MKYYLPSVSLLYVATFTGAKENFMQNYIWTEAGVHKCPENYDPIRNNAKACSAISRIFGVKYNRHLNVANGKIAYCYASNVGADGELSHTSLAHSNTDYGASDSLLCRKPRFVRQTISIDRCPAGYVPITDDDRCAEASAALGIGNEPTKNGHDDTRWDVVCFVPFVNPHTGELDPLYSTTRLNSNYHSRAAWICERRRVMTRPRAATTGRTTPAPTEGPTASSTAGPTVGPTASTTTSPTALPTTHPNADPTHGPTTSRQNILIVGSAFSTGGPSADATGTDYLLTDAGVHMCPVNSKRINNAPECFYASITLGIGYVEIPDEAAIVANESVAYCAVVDISAFGGGLVAHLSKSYDYINGERDSVICSTAVPTHGLTTARLAPSADPTARPTPGPTAGPTTGPTVGPTTLPTVRPTADPTDGPTTARPAPSADPTHGPTTRRPASLRARSTVAGEDTNVDAADTHYLRTDAGVHRCPDHYRRIDSTAECVRASMALGMRYYAGQDANHSVAHCAVLDISEMLFSFDDEPSQNLGVAFLSYTYDYIDGDKVTVICAP